MIGIAQEDRDAYGFLFNINNKEDHLRFARISFGAKASPFILGATLRYHIDQHRDVYEATVKDLLENTYETS